MLRVGVKQKGCSGNSYNLEFTDKKGKFDEIVQQDGKSVMIKWESAEYNEYLSNAKFRCNGVSGFQSVDHCAWFGNGLYTEQTLSLICFL